MNTRVTYKDFFCNVRGFWERPSKKIWSVTVLTYSEKDLVCGLQGHLFLSQSIWVSKHQRIKWFTFIWTVALEKPCLCNNYLFQQGHFILPWFSNFALFGALYKGWGWGRAWIDFFAPVRSIWLMTWRKLL